MIRILPLMLIISVVKSYDFNIESCSNIKYQQSPIRISSSESLYFDEKYFRFLQNNYEFLTTYNEWSYMPELNAVGVKPAANQTDFGYFTFVKDWAIYKFNLNKVVFRVGSEHIIDGNTFDVEMQLIHSLDNTFYPPGRRIDLGVNNLVISVFFLATEQNDPAASKLFDFMNLNGFAISSLLDSTGINDNSSAYMNRNIKLHHIIQHQPSYLYKGSLTFPECEPALWLLFSQYHLIKKSDLDILTNVIKSNTNLIDPSTKTNTRNIKETVPTTKVYRNYPYLDNLTPRTTLMAYSSASHLNLGFVTIIGLLFFWILVLF